MDRVSSERWWHRGLPVTGACLGILLISACQGTSPAVGGGSSGTSSSPSPTAAAAQISITPATGAKDVKPGQGITVTAAHGKLTSVSVTGGQVAGAMNATGTSWQSTWALPVNSHLVVTAKAYRSC